MATTKPVSGEGFFNTNRFFPPPPVPACQAFLGRFVLVLGAGCCRSSNASPVFSFSCFRFRATPACVPWSHTADKSFGAGTVLRDGVSELGCRGGPGGDLPSRHCRAHQHRGGEVDPRSAGFRPSRPVDGSSRHDTTRQRTTQGARFPFVGLPTPKPNPTGAYLGGGVARNEKRDVPTGKAGNAKTGPGAQNPCAHGHAHVAHLVDWCLDRHGGQK